MHNSKLISIVIPCYNAQKYISETIQSVLDQTYQNFEIIVIDDGSTDKSHELIKSFSKKDERIKYFYQQNQGVCSARNDGFRHAAGDYILFLDSDDILEKSFLEDRYIFLENNLSYGLCGSKITKIDENGNIFSNGIVQHAPTEELKKEILLYDENVVSIPSNLLIRKSVFKNKKPFNESLNSTGDKYFLVELSDTTKCSNIETASIRYRIRDDSMSGNLSKSLFKDNELFVKLLKENNLIPKEIRKDCLFNNYYILSAMSFKVRDYFKLIEYITKMFFLDPLLFFKNIWLMFMKKER